MSDSFAEYKMPHENKYYQTIEPKTRVTSEPPLGLIKHNLPYTLTRKATEAPEYVKSVRIKEGKLTLGHLYAGAFTIDYSLTADETQELVLWLEGKIETRPVFKS